MQSSRLLLSSWRLLGLLLLFSCFTSGSIIAQDAQQTNLEFNIITLKHTNAFELAQVLDQAIGKDRARIVADPRTNSLLVRASPEDLKAVQALVARLDMESDLGEPTMITRIIPVKNIIVDEHLQQVIATAVLANDAKFALDSRTNSVVVRGAKSTVESVERILQTLEKLAIPKNKEIKGLQVRIVWLMDGGAPKPEGQGGEPAKVRSVPEDLKKIEAPLAKVGIEKLWLVGQLLVKVEPGKQFRIQGESWPYSTPGTYTWKVDGKVQVQNDDILMAIELDIKERYLGAGASPGGEPPTLATNLSTQLTTTPGHVVVLGTTPTGDRTSVFVVQVLPEQERK